MLRIAVHEGRAVLAAQAAVRVAARPESNTVQAAASPRDVPAEATGADPIALPPSIQGLQVPNRPVRPRSAKAVFRAAIQAAQAGLAGGSVQGVQGVQAASRGVHTQTAYEECGVSCQGPQGDGDSIAALQFSNMFTPVNNSSCQGVQQTYQHGPHGALTGAPSSPHQRGLHMVASRGVHTQTAYEECGVSCQGPQGDGDSIAALQFSNMFTPVNNSSCQGVQQEYCHRTGVLSGAPFGTQTRGFHTLARRHVSPAASRGVHTQTAFEECGVSCQGPQGDGDSIAALQFSNMFTPVNNSSCQGVQQDLRSRPLLTGTQPRCLHSLSFPRGFCTSAVARCPQTGQGQSQGRPPTQKERLKRAVRDYGATVVVFHVGISLMSLGGFYLAVSSGIDVVALLHKLGVGKAIAESGVAAGASTFVIAYAVHKVFAPVRIGITLTCVPFVVRYLRSLGILR